MWTTYSPVEEVVGIGQSGHNVSLFGSPLPTWRSIRQGELTFSALIASISLGESLRHFKAHRYRQPVDGTALFIGVALLMQ
jgi:hypothetical protein